MKKERFRSSAICVRKRQTYVKLYKPKVTAFLLPVLRKFPNQKRRNYYYFTKI